MNIRETKALKRFAAQRLADSTNRKRVLLIYAGVTLGMTMAVTVINYVLGLQIDQLGGLSNIGLRTVLSTMQTVLPLIQSACNMCLGVGFQAAMLRLARGQYTSPNTLRLGFDRFWVLLRSALIQAMIYTSVVFLAMYVGIMIFMATPLSQGVVDLLMPYLSEVTVLDAQPVLGEEVYVQFNQMIWPAYLICGVILAVSTLPVMYTYRMVNYVIIDRPGLGAMAALRESKHMMRGNRLALLKLDVCLWPYYLAQVLASVVAYGDVILPMLGVKFPWSSDVSYFVFYGLYLAVTFAIYYFLMERVEVIYALAYDGVKPEEKQENSVVLGNIFQM